MTLLQPSTTSNDPVQAYSTYRHKIRAFLDFDLPASALPEPSWGPIGKEVYERTYSRDIETGEVDADGAPITRKEVWAETVRRVVLGNLGYAPHSTRLPDEDIDLFDAIYKFRMVPAGRHLWVTGTTNPYSRNCWSTTMSEKTSDHFRFSAARLFEGGGVGANYSVDLMSKGQPVVGSLDVYVTCASDHADVDKVREAAASLWVSPEESTFGDAFDTDDVLVVDDSREGWVDAWVKMIDLACTPGDHKLVIDVSQVRPHGAVLRTFGGKASGPAPLATAVVGISRVLDSAQGRRLSGLEAMTIDHEIASSIVAGGARRSARMSLMHWSDPDVFDFMACKASGTGHWSTNLSVEIDETFHDALAAGDEHAEAVLAAVAEGMARNGEPGFVDTGVHSVGEMHRIRIVNPCAEASLEPNESCNLGSINLEAFGPDVDGALAAFRLMARFLYRATLNPYPDEDAQVVEARNRRIGVGIMGLQGWAASQGVRLSELPKADRLLNALHGFRASARAAADHLADVLGLPRSVKVTAVAPTGTISQMSGCTPGVHPVFARYFVRRVRYANTDDALSELERQGYRIEDDLYASDTKVVSFPVRDAILDRYDEDLIEQADEFSFTQFMELVAAVQSSFCFGSDGQAVSATGSIPRDTDPAVLVAEMRPLLGRLKGVTVFPETSMEMAPLTRVTKEEFEAARYDLIDRAASVTGDSNDGNCAGGACPIR